MLVAAEDDKVTLKARFLLDRRGKGLDWGRETHRISKRVKAWRPVTEVKGLKEGMAGELGRW